MRAAPTPRWVLRHHAPTPVHAVSFANGHEFVVAGDADGRVSVTATADYRPRLFWAAHSSTVLRAAVWEGYIVTHGRDNRICLWEAPEELICAPSGLGGLDMKRTDAPPPLVLELPVNALNYCAFDMVARGARALLAVPNTLESAHIDIYELPAARRIVAAIGSDVAATPGTVRPAIAMALRLFESGGELHLMAGYEDGSVTLWALDERGAVSLRWSERRHIESVMSLALAREAAFAVSVGADDRVAMYCGDATVRATRHFGNAAASIRNDARILAVGSWDARVRIYALPAIAQLATLAYHKESVYAVAFASGEHAFGVCEAPPRVPDRWLACASKDGRISLWDVSFTHDDAT